MKPSTRAHLTTCNFASPATASLACNITRGRCVCASLRLLVQCERVLGLIFQLLPVVRRFKGLAAFIPHHISHIACSFLTGRDLLIQPVHIGDIFEVADRMACSARRCR